MSRKERQDSQASKTPRNDAGLGEGRMIHVFGGLGSHGAGAGSLLI